MIADMCVSVSLLISGPASKKSVSLRDDCLVVVKRHFKPNGTAMKFGALLVMVNCMLVSSASDHGSCVNERSDIINVVIFPVAWV